MPSIEINDGVAQAMETDTVRAALAAVADGVLPRAVGLANAAGAYSFARSLHRESGTRPGSHAAGGLRRPFERVIADSEGAEAVEHGDVGVTRQAILARATGGGG